jgi:hypothetical protein
MKQFAAIALFAVAGFLPAGSALAQKLAVQTTVPFDFTLGSTILPSGTYTISPVSDDQIEIQNRETHLAVLTPAYATVRQSKNGGELVFDKSAGHYFLREILCEFAAMNVNLPPSKLEKGTRVQEAKIPSAGGQVVVGGE